MFAFTVMHIENIQNSKIRFYHMHSVSIPLCKSSALCICISWLCGAMQLKQRQLPHTSS